MEGRTSKRSIIVAVLAALLCALAVSMAMGPSTLLLAEEANEGSDSGDESNSGSGNNESDTGSGNNESDTGSGNNESDTGSGDTGSGDTGSGDSSNNESDTGSGDGTTDDGTTDDGTTDDGTTDDGTTDDGTTEESEEGTESSQTTYDVYYLTIDGESWYMVVYSTGSVSLQVMEDDGSAGLTMGYDVTDNGDGTYTLTAQADVSGFPAEFTIYADEEGNLYLVDYETTEGESTASDEETLAQTGDNSSAMVAGVASMGAIALAAGVLAGKRRKA